MLAYDLHTHSNISDGCYTPMRLVEQAAARGIKTLALTDHDATTGLAEAGEAAAQHGISLVTGVEISTTWQDKSIHIVGLNLNPDFEDLQTGLKKLQAQRGERAKEIGRRLEKYGLAGLFDAVQARAGEGMLTRTHFAQCLYDLGIAASVRDAFDRYLARGKPGYVATRWTEMEQAIAWIRGAGGVAVVAHPQRYKLTGSWLRRLLGEFKEMGGEGMEVLSGTAPPGEVQSSTEYAKRFNLLASCGSDFHNPEHAWPKLGRLPPMPTGLTPVWSVWET